MMLNLKSILEKHMSSKPEQKEDGQYRGVIYEYRNKTTGKPYVGKTDNEMIRRQSWKNNGSKSYGGKKLMEARQQFGTGDDAWDYTILEELFSDSLDSLKKDLKLRETHWIREKDAVENGYNGSYGDGNLGVKFSPERAKHCGDSMRGKHHSEKTKAVISSKSKGRKHTEEAKALISKKLTGIKRTPEQRKAQSERMKGINPVAATAAAKAWVKKNGSYWKSHPVSEETKAKIKETQQERGIDTIATWPDGHEETFHTMLDAAKATGVGVGSVHYSITNNNTKTRNGYTFRKA